MLARAERSYPLSTPQPGWSEQDPEDWWRAAEAALAEVSAGVEVVGIGLSGQMHGLVALDAGGRVLRPAILWNDQRTGEECAEIEDLIGVDRLIELTGNRALAGFTAPKLLWLRRHEPATFARIARICLPKDYVRLRLTGEWATDVADASGTLLLDVARRRWSEEVLAALDIPLSWLPPVLESSEISGRFGGIPVAAGAGDCAAAALGVGIDRSRAALDRARHLGRRVRRATGLPAGARRPSPHVLPRGAGRVARHGRDALRRRLAAVVSRPPWRPRRRSTSSSPRPTRWEAGADGLFFLPYLAGERTPHADPKARGAFVGLSMHHDRGALVRAVLEGVAFGLRDSLELLRGLGVEASHARVSGGGSRGDVWLRIVASVLGIPLETTAAEEGSAYGAALLGGVAGGMFGDVHEAAARCVRVERRIEPDAAEAAQYEPLYRRYRALYPALHDDKEERP